jgi:hypothetical protein
MLQTFNALDINVFLYIYHILAGVPSVAWDDQSEKLMVLFEKKKKKDCRICGNVLL